MLAAGFIAASWIPRAPRPVRAAEPERRLFLVKFGLDGKAEVDWSGSISAPQTFISGWQFDPEQDRVSGLSWSCATRRQNYWDTPYERSMRGTSNRDKVTAKGVWIAVAPPLRPIRVSTRQGDFTFEPTYAPGDGPQFFLDGRASVEAAAISEPAGGLAEAEDYPSILEARDGSLWIAYQTFDGRGDRIRVRRLQGGVWSEAETLAGPGGDFFRTEIAQDGAGRIWVIWSAHSGGNFDLWGRAFNGRSWSSAQRLTSAANSDIYHDLVADAAGNLYLAWQSARSGDFDIYLRRYDGKAWSEEIKVSESVANDWEPSVAVASDGRVTIVWDTYAAGNYDVVGRTWSSGVLGPTFPIAASGAFEARPSARYDSRGRLWVAFDEGDWNWGKDYGSRISENGRGLLVRRQVRVAVIENGNLRQTPTPVSVALPEELRQAFQKPNLVLDNDDHPWLFFRTRVNLPRAPGERSAYRALWRLHGTTWRGGRWSPSFEFAGGQGAMDMAAAAAARRTGGIAVVWAADGRQFPLGRPERHQIRFATLTPAPPAAQIPLVAFQPSAENMPAVHLDEAAQIARVRNYRTQLGGRRLRIARGDLHRHTDLSWDGNRDGSLEDAYRYALDAAALDFLAVADHQAGQSIPYHWWRIQKAADLFAIQDRFAPLYAYERSVAWPNGHRNVFFASRGRPVLEIPEAEAQGREGAARLYAYLRRFSGLTSSHTSATGAGTDWRDSDPAVEPVVEIYQGYRVSYEGPEAPRVAANQQAQRFAAGYVQNAWAKGIKMGVQSSSDHVSTHISYAAVYVENISREAILAAMKARRSYASTGNLIVETRLGDCFMGAACSGPAMPPLRVRVYATAPLARVEVIRSNRVVYSVSGRGPETTFSWTDGDVQEGENWYYVRALQLDGQIVWSSPIWFRRKGPSP